MGGSFKKVFIENDRWKLYLEGLGNSLQVAFFGFLLAFVLGVFLALTLYYAQRKKKLKWLAFIIRQYINLIRAIPLLLLLLLGYFSILVFIESAILIAILVFGIHSSAYIAEIIRGGIESVDKGQVDAAKSLGFSYNQTMLKIVLPQGLKNCLPSIGNELITLLKMTSIVGWISIIDLTQAANIISTNTFEFFMPLVIIAIVYVVLVSILSLTFKMIERWLGRYS